MIGPSSSHTAGAVRLGALARAVFGGTPSRVTIGLHGSFASTGRGHGTHLALVAGLLGMAPDDERIPDSLRIAREQGVEVAFVDVDLGEAHPNSAVFEMESAADLRMRVQGASLGGGAVVVTDIDGFEVEISGDLPVLLVEHFDRPGEIALVTGMLADSGTNIASMQVSREQRGARALMLIATDSPVDAVTRARLSAASGVTEVRSVDAV